MASFCNPSLWHRVNLGVLKRSRTNRTWPAGKELGDRRKGEPRQSLLGAAEWIEFVERAESADCYARASTAPRSVPGVPPNGSGNEGSRTTHGQLPRRQIARDLRSSACLSPLSLFGTAAVLALGSAFLLTKWNASKAPTKARVAVFGGGQNSAAPLTQSTEPPPKPSAELDGTRHSMSNQAYPHLNRQRNPDSASPSTNDIDDPSAPATDQQYCLIGSDGVFTMPSPDYKLKDRQKIEESYADRVDMARKHYDANTGAESDPDGATAQLNQDLESAAEERDQKLGTIYQKQD